MKNIQVINKTTCDEKGNMIVNFTPDEFLAAIRENRIVIKRVSVAQSGMSAKFKVYVIDPKTYSLLHVWSKDYSNKHDAYVIKGCGLSREIECISKICWLLGEEVYNEFMKNQKYQSI